MRRAKSNFGLRDNLQLSGNILRTAMRAYEAKPSKASVQRVKVAFRIANIRKQLPPE